MTAEELLRSAKKEKKSDDAKLELKKKSKLEIGKRAELDLKAAMRMIDWGVKASYVSIYLNLTVGKSIMV
eukprot:CAMPEP_0167754074 /NCGR_PEP_ID=MMETSP0110_2-20121227/8068_1 /TAXON_ID=629695 /ORGANISM="Gymnochlora sp., Strain CCMP2014" /LENGTH=69 /DNA_ID=CAMNT_0007639913 /DNA_START=425 /DNA_END=632 /DNA_ORIENTATION=-